MGNAPNLSRPGAPSAERGEGSDHPRSRQLRPAGGRQGRGGKAGLKARRPSGPDHGRLASLGSEEPGGGPTWTTPAAGARSGQDPLREAASRKSGWVVGRSHLWHLRSAASGAAHRERSTALMAELRRWDRGTLPLRKEISTSFFGLDDAGEASVGYGVIQSAGSTAGTRLYRSDSVTGPRCPAWRERWRR